MTLRVVALISVVLNICLITGAFYRAKDSPVVSEVQTSAPASKPSSEVRKAPLVPAFASTRTAVTNHFHWSQVESTDFRQYMTNLRAVGCPSETVRDLIAAEVNKLFAPRFAAVAAQTQRYYWKPGSSGLKGDLHRQLELLQQEKRDLLGALLGTEGDPIEQWNSQGIGDLAERSRFSFLPPDKEKQVREVVERYKKSASTQQFDQSGDSNEARRMREKRRQELAQVLTPEELYEVDLRESTTAESIRSQFGSRDLTEEQYRELFALRRAYEDEHGVIADYSDPEKVRQRNEARGQLERAYETALSAHQQKDAARGE